MILAQIREHERVEADAVEPVQDRSMRGRFQRDAAVAGVEHLAERALEVDRLGRRADDRANLTADPALDRAEQAGTAPGGLEHRVEEEGGRGLAARAGDAGDLELARRLAEEDVGRGRHRGPGRRDDELRDVRLDGTLDDQDDGAVRHRLHGVVMTVRPLAGYGEESGARRDRTCVVRKIPHLDGVGAAENRLRCKRGYKAPELHGGERYRVAEPSGVASGAISSSTRLERAMSENAGAATTPPQIAPRGSSIETRTTRRGSFAGTTPTNEAT